MIKFGKQLIILSNKDLNAGFRLDVDEQTSYCNKTLTFDLVSEDLDLHLRLQEQEKAKTSAVVEELTVKSFCSSIVNVDCCRL